MSTIVKQNGGKIAVLLLSGLIINILVQACQKEEAMFSAYELVINNFYFENIDSIRVNKTCYHTNCKTNSILRIPNIARGNCKIEAYTTSQLTLTAILVLRGPNPFKIVTIEPSGSFSIKD